MKIFVFGAGASKAVQNQVTYSEKHPERAPLVNELFNEQYKDAIVEGLNFDISECRSKVEETGSLEEWLTNRWGNIATLKTDRAQRAERSWFGNINLYIWNLLNKVSRTYPLAQGYSYLLKKLYDQDFGIVSFNYDTLLDQSYEDVFGIVLSDKEVYLRENFIKLHGSVNWFLKRRDGENTLDSNRHQGDVSVRIRAIAENIYNGNPMSLNKLEIIEPKHSVLSGINSVMQYFSSGGYFYPLIFMPLTGKDYNIILDFKEVLVAKAQEMFKKATDIYLIGYRANDELIQELLGTASRGTKLHVVGLSSAETISTSMLSMHPNLVKGIINDQGFSNFISNF